MNVCEVTVNRLQNKSRMRCIRLFLCFNEDEEARTPDNLIKSQVLYQLSYIPVLY